jgi:hypothetical protein
MPALAIPFLIPFAEAAGIALGAITTGIGLKTLSDKVEDYIEDNPENAQKIFAMIMPEQGIANVLKNKSSEGDEEVSETETEEVEEKPKLSGREKGMRIKEAIRRARAGKGNYSSPDAEGPAVDIRGSVIREVEDMGIADPNLKDNYKPSGYTGWKRFANKGRKKYANGGGIGSMMQPKKVAIQGGVENYKPSEMITAPKKAKSSPDHPSTELAYITQAEKDLLIKKDLHNSLNGSANKGPSGIISLNGGFGEPGGFQGGGNQSAAEAGDRGAFGGGAENAARAGAVRSAAINAGAGQNVNAGFFGGKYNDTVTQAEIAAAQAARNNPNNVFGAGAYDRTRGFGSTGLGGLMQGFNPLSLIAGLMGGPLAGLFTKGITGIKNKFNDVTKNPDDLSLRERLTGYKTQADYEKARTDRQTASRRDKMQSRR